MKCIFTLFFLFFVQILFAQQKHAAKILVDTTNYRIEQIDSIQYGRYLNGTSHHSGIDTVNNNALIKCYSPYTDDVLYIENINGGDGKMNHLSLYHADGSNTEKLTYPVSIPLDDYDIKFARWLLVKSALVKLKLLKNGHYCYLLLTFKNA